MQRRPNATNETKLTTLWWTLKMYPSNTREKTKTLSFSQLQSQRTKKLGLEGHTTGPLVTQHTFLDMGSTRAVPDRHVFDMGPKGSTWVAVCRVGSTHPTIRGPR